MSVYVLVAIIKKRLQIEVTLYIILQILTVTIFERSPLLQVLTEPDVKALIPIPYSQLNLFD